MRKLPRESARKSVENESQTRQRTGSAQTKSPKARAPIREARTAGTKTGASEAGPGAGASAADTLWKADTAVTAITTAKNNLIFIASIAGRFVAGE